MQVYCVYMRSFIVLMSRVTKMFLFLLDGSPFCQCSRNDAVLRVDEGTIADTNRFPITQLRLGDINGIHVEYLWQTLDLLSVPSVSNTCQYAYVLHINWNLWGSTFMSQDLEFRHYPFPKKREYSIINMPGSTIIWPCWSYQLEVVPIRGWCIFCLISIHIPTIGWMTLSF